MEDNSSSYIHEKRYKLKSLVSKTTVYDGFDKSIT